ncbi:hypothetical protein [Streptacidiphilus melanogenes]|uniref:hypothetical protein n=1 Tax=Streptacidiphilus melanogenes TaxID=411235 RepID=UPI001F3C9F2D|nr:hypothetical protein [Streptacidiphilus melanogenes]
MTDKTEDTEMTRAFLACTAEVARLLPVDVNVDGPDTLTAKRRARDLAHAVRRPLLESPRLADELFTPLMAAAVHDPDPSFCRWFVEPALYSFGRRRVLEALVEYLRSGSDPERAGATRAWYWAHMPLRAERSAAYAPDGTRPASLDASEEAVEAWFEVSMKVYTETTDVGVRYRVLRMLPVSRQAYPPRLHNLFDTTLSAARADPDEYNRRWARAVDGEGFGPDSR